MTRTPDVPWYEVRLARAGEEAAICDVCRAGFAVSSHGLLSPAAIERQVNLYYNPARVREEISTAGDTPKWQGYVVAVSELGEVLGAAGGGVTGHAIGSVYVLYLNPRCGAAASARHCWTSSPSNRSAKVRLNTGCQ